MDKKVKGSWSVILTLSGGRFEGFLELSRLRYRVSG